MVKIYWLFVTLAAGVLLGVLVGRHSTLASDAPLAADADSSAQFQAARARVEGQRTEDADVRAASSQDPAMRADARPPAATTALQFDTAGESPALADRSAATRETSQERTARKAEIGRSAAKAPPGQFFSAVIVNAEPGAMPETQHDIMMREERDDSWAYMREAEIENSIIAETGAGNFRKDYLECRATMCELQLSGSGPQAAALKKWFEAMNEHGRRFQASPSPQLEPAGWSMQESPENGTADVQVYYRKPQPPQPLSRPAGR